MRASMTAKMRDNMSYKIVALGVAVVLWLSMLGKKDSTMSRDFELQVLLPPRMELVSQPPLFVRVEVAGPRVVLKKLNQIQPVFTVDLTNAKAGRQIVELSREGINLPIGARVVSVDPGEFTVVLSDAKANGEGK